MVCACWLLEARSFFVFDDVVVLFPQAHFARSPHRFFRFCTVPSGNARFLFLYSASRAGRRGTTKSSRENSGQFLSVSFSSPASKTKKARSLDHVPSSKEMANHTIRLLPGANLCAKWRYFREKKTLLNAGSTVADPTCYSGSFHCVPSDL